MRKLIWQLYPSYLLIICLSIVAVMLYISFSFKSFYLNKYEEELKIKALLVKPLITANFDNREAMAKICRRWREDVPLRITVISHDGNVIVDTDHDVSFMENHESRTEITTAKKNKRYGSAIRYSTTLQQNMMYVVVPIMRNTQIIAFIRVAIPTTDIDNVISTLIAKIIIVLILCAICAIIISLIVANKISGPIEELEQGAEKLAQGDLSTRLSVSKFKEISSLAETMNKMAAQLEHKIQQVVQQRNEHEAVLASMVEGVFAVDQHARILNMNQTAQTFLQVESTDIKGKSVEEVIRNEELKQLVKKAILSSDTIEEDILLGDKEKIVQTRGIILHDQGNNVIGTLVVMNDVTRLRKLEKMRREFVANVSHELRTPITSIKGFVETLMDSDLDDKPQVQRFLKIIARQADRLHFIIEDILTLSRIEQGVEIEEISLFPSSIREVLENAIQMCEVRAKEKHIDIFLKCPQEKMEGNINPELLEQAIINLIDNAVKYSPADRKIDVEVSKRESSLKIDVKDEGRGIPPEHIPRLFERFYRVDKARSRELGGTGLGLAIVKHIIIAHKGEIKVQSEIDKGSIFSIILPK
ncbi:two-component system histidine kinase PnpS [Candidatus Uabimicrobium amorphum]|uniref:histidine kinase n=1 Tax=Uabimicrobium amorphum TaxID=2596890 RepID=A0A5S9INE6_UABAM|nr:ATP-binding protein [Candidatus Uabimicrobium amorphum]BBM83755.1 PAS domain-containing sensor histidine kinase [Candidatus Uabimicrobium amorphum]